LTSTSKEFCMVLQQHYQYLKQESGHFINLSSAAGVKVFSGGTVYSGTKFAVSAISEGTSRSRR
jgi:NADP-dependent 3-hydroxy acid dehydrogenase YdfG